MSKPYWFILIRLLMIAVFAAIGLAACGGSPETTDVTTDATLRGSTSELTTSGVVDKQNQGCESACYGSLTLSSV
jgi:ABC-type glycerol-3-phosphate transport system substrate-binding protein